MSAEKLIKRTSLGEYILECEEGKELVMWKENQLRKYVQKRYITENLEAKKYVSFKLTHTHIRSQEL